MITLRPLPPLFDARKWLKRAQRDHESRLS
jgi:hypothetical protein